MWWHLPVRARGPWLKKHSQQPSVTRDGERFTISTVRDFRFGPDGIEQEVWTGPTHIDPRAARRVWYILEHFAGNEAIAHPYLLFETDDGPIGFSIEGMRRDNEGYSGVAGILNRYPLGMLWMSVHDLLTMPLSVGCESLYVYPLALTEEEARTLCTALLEETARLEKHPRHYNTLFHNCTTILGSLFSRIRPGQAGWDIAWHLPGFSDRYFMRVGLIHATRPFQEAREMHSILPYRKEIFDARNEGADALWTRVTALLRTEGAA